MPRLQAKRNLTLAQQPFFHDDEAVRPCQLRMTKHHGRHFPHLGIGLPVEQECFARRKLILCVICLPAIVQQDVPHLTIGNGKPRIRYQIICAIHDVLQFRPDALAPFEIASPFSFYWQK
ncbi:hypothetical protein D3C72_1731590 [compost metagenome]